jgi:hypothetical protein
MDNLERLLGFLNKLQSHKIYYRLEAEELGIKLEIVNGFVKNTNEPRPKNFNRW